MILKLPRPHWEGAPPPPMMEYFNEDKINKLEFWPVLQAIKWWVNVIIFSSITQDLQVLNMLKSRRSANKTCMGWIRELFWGCALNGINIKPRYIRSEDNVLADISSRLSYTEYASEDLEVINDSQICCKANLIHCCRAVLESNTQKVWDSTHPGSRPEHHEG